MSSIDRHKKNSLYCGIYKDSPDAFIRNRGKRVLLLQGPVGPFFADLQNSLSAAGFETRRVIFNAGDMLFSVPQGRIRFRGSKAEWNTWLRFEIAQNRPDYILLFGSSRPAHMIARRVAEYFNVPVVCLEEGYLRSGYITCEIGGNNQYSPFANWKRDRSAIPAARHAVPLPIKQVSSFVTMSLWGALYYFVRDSFSGESDDDLFHRQREQLLPLIGSWMVHIIHRITARSYENLMFRGLRQVSGYIIVPLQVSTDSQLQTASRGWNNHKLIDACLNAATRSPHHQGIVFKLHPLERGGQGIKRLILRRSKELGIAKRQVRIIASGRIGDLTRNSSGMVVINSTSAFSALHHNIPVLVLGDAVYRHVDIVTVGDSNMDVVEFFKLRGTKSRDVVDAFLADLKAESLLPGDFYEKTGREVAVAEVTAKITGLQVSHRCATAMS